MNTLKFTMTTVVNVLVFPLAVILLVYLAHGFWTSRFSSTGWHKYVDRMKVLDEKTKAGFAALAPFGNDRKYEHILWRQNLESDVIEKWTQAGLASKPASRPHLYYVNFQSTTGTNIEECYVVLDTSIKINKEQMPYTSDQIWRHTERAIEKLEKANGISPPFFTAANVFWWLGLILLGVLALFIVPKQYDATREFAQWFYAQKQEELRKRQTETQRMEAERQQQEAHEKRLRDEHARREEQLREERILQAKTQLAEQQERERQAVLAQEERRRQQEWNAAPKHRRCRTDGLTYPSYLPACPKCGDRQNQEEILAHFDNFAPIATTAAALSEKVRPLLSFQDYGGIGNLLLEDLAVPKTPSRESEAARYWEKNARWLVAKMVEAEPELNYLLPHRDRYLPPQLRGNWEADVYPQLLIFAFALGAERTNLPEPHHTLVPYYHFVAQQQLTEIHKAADKYKLRAGQAEKEQRRAQLLQEMETQINDVKQSGMEQYQRDQEIDYIRSQFAQKLQQEGL